MNSALTQQFDTFEGYLRGVSVLEDETAMGIFQSVAERATKQSSRNQHTAIREGVAAIEFFPEICITPGALLFVELLESFRLGLQLIRVALYNLQNEFWIHLPVDRHAHTVNPGL
jgi:hypothetical protein